MMNWKETVLGVFDRLGHLPDGDRARKACDVVGLVFRYQPWIPTGVTRASVSSYNCQQTFEWAETGELREKLSDACESIEAAEHEEELRAMRKCSTQELIDELERRGVRIAYDCD